MVCFSLGHFRIVHYPSVLVDRLTQLTCTSDIFCICNFIYICICLYVNVQIQMSEQGNLLPLCVCEIGPSSADDDEKDRLTHGPWPKVVTTLLTGGRGWKLDKFDIRQQKCRIV